MNLKEAYIKAEKGNIYYTKNSDMFLSMVKSIFISKNIPVRVYYDINKDLYVFGNALDYIHTELATGMKYYSKIYSVDEMRANVSYVKQNCALFQVLPDDNFKAYDMGDGYSSGWFLKLDDLIFACRSKEYKKVRDNVPLFKGHIGEWMDVQYYLSKKNNINETVEDKILYIIRGLPGSGKSTLAHKLTDNVVEADQYFYDDKGNYNWSADKLHQAHNWCYNTVKKYMEEGRDKIVVANTFVKNRDYKNYVELAKEFNYKVDIKTCKGNYGSIHNVPEETMNRMRNKFQETPLNESDEKLIAYHGSQHKKFNFRDDKVLYLTTNKEKAISYAKREWDEGLIEGEVPVVYTFEVSIKKPYICHTEDEFQCEFCDVNMNEEGGKEDLIEKGYDSIKYQDLIGVFSSSQIKLVDAEVLPPSMDYYYPRDTKYGDEDINDYYYDEEELKESINDEPKIGDKYSCLINYKNYNESMWEIIGISSDKEYIMQQIKDKNNKIVTQKDNLKKNFLKLSSYDGSETQLDESEEKIWPDGSMFISNDSIWQIYNNDGKFYNLIQFRNDGIKIKWKLSINKFPSKDLIPYEKNNYEGDDTELDEDASKDKAFLDEQIAYCGSEKDYDVPDLKIIGNGEGTAVHGYGFYFAKDFNIANRYRMAYIKKPYSYIFKGIIYNKIDICSNINKDTMFKQIMYDLLKKIYHEKMTLNDVLQECKNEIEYYDNSIKNVNKDKKDYIKFCKICLNGYINAKKFFINVNEEDINNIQIYGGQVLKVELPENEYLIDEQKSLKEQSKYVKNILYKIFKKLNIDYNEDMSGKDILVDISNANMLKNKSSHLPLSRNKYELSDDIRDFYYENQKNVYIFGSLMLANNGIKGITYIGNEDGRCYVIFNPNDIKIIDKLIKENYNNIISDDSDILMEGIEEVKKYFPNVPENMFQKLIDLDPTYTGGNILGKYCKWILNLYNKGLLKVKDFYKVTEYLITFKDNLSKIPNKDISKYKTLKDLEQAVKSFIGQKDISKKEQARIIKKDAKKIMETDEWLCITPLTQEASCYYGANTKWCTASKENNMFNNYNKDGPLYIFINKKDGSKYQFHPETLEFRNALDNKVPPAVVFNDKTILKFIKEKVMEAIENGDLDIYDGEIITGLTNDEDSLAIIATNSFSFFSSIFNYSKGTKEEQMFDLLSEYNEYGIDEIYDIIKDMALTFSNSEKINKLKDDVYKQKLEGLLENIKDMILLQINEHQDVWNVLNYKYKEDLEEMQIYVNLISNNYEGYYDDVVLEWFMNYNIDTPHSVKTQISDEIITPESNLKKVTESFLEGLREIFKEMDNDGHIKESIIKNPSFEMIQETLKEQDLGFTFNPIKNDLIIYKDISLMESTNNLSGILSPKLVEIKSDDEEYAEKVLRNSLKKIFPDGYKMIVY